MPRLLQDWVTEQALRRPGAPAIVSGGARLTYAEVDALSNQLARRLKDGGCRQGDRVLVLCPKSPMAIVALLGTNGAGKTTTLRGISGFLGADDAQIVGGRVVFLGETVTGRPPHELARRGLVLVPERDKVFEALTVRENLRALVPGRRADRDRSGVGDRAGSTVPGPPNPFLGRLPHWHCSLVGWRPQLASSTRRAGFSGMRSAQSA